VAVKCLPDLGATPTQFEALIREVELCARFDSKHIVQVFGACLDKRSTICLIMELVEGGNLHQRIHDPRRPRMTLLESLEVCLFSSCASTWGGGGTSWLMEGPTCMTWLEASEVCRLFCLCSMCVGGGGGGAA